MDGRREFDAIEQDGPTAETTVTSFRVVVALEGRDDAGVSELAAELDLSKGAVHKHLTTLTALGYVVREGGRYRLSLAFLGLGTSVRARMEPYRAAHEPLENLADATGEVASLMVPERSRAVYVTRVSGDTVPTHDRRAGEAVPLTASAGGKAILAYTPPDERERLLDERGLPARTENTITDRDTLEEELQTVHDNRLAHDRGELASDHHAVAAPITGADDAAIAAVSVSGPADRMTEKALSQDFPSIVGSTATAIQNRLEL